MTSPSPAQNPSAPQAGQKMFIPLENNPEVLTTLSRSLLGGASPSFHDVFTLDKSHLETLQPASALIVTIPSQVYYRRRAADNDLPADSSLRVTASSDFPSNGSGVDSVVTGQSIEVRTQPSRQPLYIPQTIGHACGLISLLHALCNTDAKALAGDSGSGTVLNQFINDTKYLTPKERAKYLYDSREIEEAHMTASRSGDTIAPSAQEPNGHHFITFVQLHGKLWELEGSKQVGGPICRGPVADHIDVLSEASLKASIEPYFSLAGGNMAFSMVAMKI